ncbi:MAG: AAA family ATPase [Spirochaetia bacterium]|nr:AAA family ATPase [Spirochaetia bacterium]
MVSEQSENYRTFFLEFFMNPDSYPDQTQFVHKIETHASYVFLTDRFVYKIKKNINLGFLDFSTIEKRKHFTNQELMLNQRLCSDIYIEVLPVWKNNNSFSFTKLEDGAIAEYALKMHRMSDEDFFLERLRLRRITESDIEEIALLLADFYKRQTVTPEIIDWGCTTKLKITTDENFEQTEAFINASISKPSFDLIRLYTDRFYQQQENLFQRRMEQGWIKNCHGDMHLEHFHKHRGAWCIFDCIEFNERFRYIDAACDIGFLLMDFDFNGRSDLALSLDEKLNQFLPDTDRKQMMDFYKCYRAYVRGKVDSMIAKNVREEQGKIQDAQRYFHLSLKYALIGSKPAAIVFMGRIATGKSRLSRRFSEETGIEIFSCDTIRKTMAGMMPTEQTPDAKKKELYSEDFSDKTYRAVLDASLKSIRTGNSAVLDCTFSRKKYRDFIIENFQKHQIPYIFIETVVPDRIMKERLKKRSTGKDVISDARIEDFEKINSVFEKPDELSENHYLQISTAGEKDETFFNLGKLLMEKQGN